MVMRKYAQNSIAQFFYLFVHCCPSCVVCAIVYVIDKYRHYYDATVTFIYSRIYLYSSVTHGSGYIITGTDRISMGGPSVHLFPLYLRNQLAVDLDMREGHDHNSQEIES